MSDVLHLATALAAAVSDRDPRGIAACYRDDGVMISPQGLLEGREQIEWYFQQMFTALPDLRNIVRHQFVCGDLAVAEWTLVGTHLGPWQLPGGIELAGTGRVVSFAGCSTHLAEDGGFVSGQIYYDQLALYRQVGCVLRPA